MMSVKKLRRQYRILFLYSTLFFFVTGCAANEFSSSSATINDPWENTNREVHKLNKNIDRLVLRPTSEIYGTLIPQPIRLSIANFHGNLQEPKRFFNHLIQRKYLTAGSDMSRFVLNSSIGILGLFDVASWLKLFPQETNFDETFRYFYFPAGPYLEVPLTGPSSVRGSLGLIADYTLNPLLMLRGPIQGLSFVTFEAINVVNERYEYSSIIDSLLYKSSDSYSSTRLTYLQNMKNKNDIDDSDLSLASELFDPTAEF